MVGTANNSKVGVCIQETTVTGTAYSSKVGTCPQLDLLCCIICKCARCKSWRADVYPVSAGMYCFVNCHNKLTRNFRDFGKTCCEWSHRSINPEFNFCQISCMLTSPSRCIIKLFLQFAGWREKRKEEGRQTIDEKLPIFPEGWRHNRSKSMSSCF